jgi:hypothetical protein
MNAGTDEEQPVSATDPTPEARAAVRRLARRMRRLLFASALINGLAATLVIGAGALVALRVLADLAPPPAWWWSFAAAPPVAWAALRTRRAVPDDAACALYLDRRLGLRGLLLASIEADAGAWQPHLAPGLGRLREALPRLDGRALTTRLAGACAMLAIVVLLPPPAGASMPTPHHAAAAAALEELVQRLDQLRKDGRLDRETQQELEERLAELTRRMAERAPPRWSDIDGLADRVAHELQVRDESRARIAQELERLLGDELARALGAQAGRNGDGSDGTDGEQGDRAEGMQGMDGRAGVGGDDAAQRTLSEARRRLGELLREAEALGDLPELPPDVAEWLAEMARDAAGRSPSDAGDGPPDALPLSAEELAALAERLRELMAQGLDPAMFARLAEMPEGVSATASLPSTCQGAGCTGCAAGTCPGGAQPGRGGISRGPGAAGLRGADGELPDGRPAGGGMIAPQPDAPSRGGELVRSGRDEADVNPERDTTAGTAGTADRGATAAGAGRLGPRHRAVVRRYFGGDVESEGADR